MTSIFSHFAFQFKSHGIEVSHRKHFVILLCYMVSYLFSFQLLVFSFLFNNGIHDQLTAETALFDVLSYLFVYNYNTGAYMTVLSYYFLMLLAVSCRIQLLNEGIR